MSEHYPEKPLEEFNSADEFKYDRKKHLSLKRKKPVNVAIKIPYINHACSIEELKLARKVIQKEIDKRGG